MAKTGVIYGINGPIVHIKGDVGFEMHEMVYVGKDNLVGEVIGLASDDTIIEVYEETTGIKPGEIVTGTGAPVSVTLAPGILNNIFDGIERPLSEIAKQSGNAEIYRAAVEFYIDTKQEEKVSPLLNACTSDTVLEALKDYVSGEPEFSLDETETYDEVQALELTGKGKAYDRRFRADNFKYEIYGTDQDR